MVSNDDTPKACDDRREGLSAMIDGEASEAEVAALRAHLRDCRACEAHFEALSILHIRLREELTDSTDPEMVWRRVSAALDAEDAGRGKSQSTRVGGTWRRWAPLAAAAMILVAVFFGPSGLWMSDIGTLPVVTETNRDFETFRVRGRLLDMAAAEPGEIRQWMAAKLDFELPTDMTGPAGFKLAGGRLCSFLNRRLAFFQYQKGDVSLSLYVMKRAGLDLPDNMGIATVRAEQGFTTVVWQRGGLVYLVVSELPEHEVEALAESLIEGIAGSATTRSGKDDIPHKRSGASRA